MTVYRTSLETVTASAAEVVEDVVDVREVLPDEFVDARVVRNHVVAAAGDLVVRCQALDAAIVHEGPHDVRDLRLEHEGDVIVENGDRVGPALREVHEADCADRGLDCGEVPGCNIYGAVIIPDEEVEHVTPKH